MKLCRLRNARRLQMPVHLRQVKGGWEVRTPNMVHSKHTTRAKAKAQVRLLNAIDHGYDPDEERRKRKKLGGY